MSDLSLPPLALLPAERSAVPAHVSATDAPMAWPTPPYADYPAAKRFDEPEPCEVEGLTGQVSHGLLARLDMESAVAYVQVPPARGNLKLRFTQFRRITLKRPLQPGLAVLDGPVGLQLQRPEPVAWVATLAGGVQVQGHTLGHVSHVAGVFLFPPAGGVEDGAVLRTFMPRQAYERVDIGPRIGELLVEQQAASAQQVDAALQEQDALRNRKLGDILVEQQVLTPEQLLDAVEQQSRMPMVRIGEALAALGFITPQQLNDALELQKKDRSVPLGELLVRHGWVNRSDLQTALSRKMGYPIVDVAQFPAEGEAVNKLPYAQARRIPALPLLMRSGRVIVALEDPSARDAIDEIEFATGMKVVPVLARAGTLLAAVDTLYQRLGHTLWNGAAAAPEPVTLEFEADDAGKLLATLEQAHDSHESAHEDDGNQLEQSDNSLVRLINTMILEAKGQGVSDIHIETQPGRAKVKVRFRKDGVLKPYLELPHTYRSALIARLKIMCDLDISERRKPQDGKINFSRFVPGQKLELRVATIPTANGLEDAVLRLLASAKPMPLGEMGLSPANLARLSTAIQRPYGMVLCVGPTGSGKTTTLHSALGALNTPDRKIWTAEDPIEITQEGLRQVQVNPKIDFTFAKALRAFLRADPDVVMVGEIRDRETAQMAVEASLTGHLVMSTLHTNSAPETVTRLLDMGMDPFNFADSLLAVLAQRLVRRLCKQCKVALPASPQQADELLDDWLHAFAEVDKRPDREALRADWLQRFGVDGQIPRWEAKGCDHCDHSGLRGRVGLHELMLVDRDLRRLIQTSARAEELQRCAMASGLRTLRQDGIEKVLQGLTTIEEVRSSSNS
ncbi:type II secretory pathway, ATPase PulE/Tfp pilus assembly pathway, ATPase PilB [Burkholderiales bacterium JOSHI_001]|nr:type II secretory pathway, ATPase PulE/Tfp pilus assembly pathway, ATPase PilB [Burkholderiales bacterium JOSHI_001]